MGAGSSGKIFRFGSFEADINEGKLTKSGIRIRLQEQPFRILALLLENAGQLVTREQIRQELWSSDTFVEFDKALNTAVGKLRVALSDSADNPRFLETVPRRGYRFVAPVTFLPVDPLDTTPVSTLSIPAVPQAGLEPKPIESDSVPIRSGWKRISTITAGIGGFALLAATASGIYLVQSRGKFRITSKDTIVVADFFNTTGEAVFDDALRQGLEVGLEQSPSLKVLPDRKAGRILKQMGRSSDDRMTGRVAIEVCQRAGGKVAVQGTIASLGTNYLVGLAAIRCDSGDPIANEQIQAKRKEDVVDALGKATTHLRSRLGESLPSIQKYNAPLEQATTASLDALNAYSLALSTWDKKGDRDSLPIFKKAVELDPNFAMAYGAMATIHHNLGQNELARENASKAYELRERVTESEKAIIEGRYYAYVTGELDQSAQVHALEVQNYPESASSYNHLANDLGKLGRYEESVQNFRKAMLLDPTRANTYANLAIQLLALNHTDEAVAVLSEARQRKLQTDSLLQVAYWIAFLHDDNGEMERIVKESSSVSGAEGLLLSEQADTEAYRGRFAKARELSRAAATQMERDGDEESAASYLAQSALREAEVGHLTQARKLIQEARKQSQGNDVTILAAVCMARMGDLKEAEKLIDFMDKDWPKGTYIQKYWLPLIRGMIDLRRQASKAVDDLGPETPLEFAAPSALPAAALYPAYVRGQAYLAMGDGQKAAAEFQKLIDHRGMVFNYPLGALSRLGLARAYARSSEREKARAGYDEFFKLWKDADPDIPILNEARAERAKLF